MSLGNLPPRKPPAGPLSWPPAPDHCIEFVQAFELELEAGCQVNGVRLEDGESSFALWRTEDLRLRNRAADPAPTG